MAQRITDSFVKNLEAPESGQRIVFDDDKGQQKRIKGFGVRVTANGAKAFILEYWRGGKQRRYTIGRYPDWSVVKAREEAKETRQRIDKGEDPVREREKLRTDPRVNDLADRYRDEHLFKKAPQSQRDDWNIIQKEILPQIGDRLVSEIEQDDIEAIHRTITERGTPVRANRVLAVLSKMFSIAMKKQAGKDVWRTQLDGNPCKGVDRNPEYERDRFYSESEINRIVDALASYPGKSAANVIRLVMLTGCRPGEAMNAPWSQFDLEKGTWTKPAASTKTRKPHRVPLAPPAIELLNQIRAEVDEDCPYVCPGRSLNGWEPLKQYRTCWEYVMREAELEPDEEGFPARVYDLRHTFATGGVGAGLSLPLIGKLLGHTQARTTQRYAHAADDPLREAAEKAAARISNAGKGGRDSDNVEEIGGRS